MIESPTRLIDLNPQQIRELQILLSQLDLYPVSEIDGIYGPNTFRAWKTFKQTHYLSDPELIGAASFEKLKLEAAAQPILILRKHYDAIFIASRAHDREIYFLPINKAMREFQINTPKRIAAFLAQVSHESGGLRYSEEIASGFAYEGRIDLGNTVKGDGMRFKGRGLIQLTGRANYRNVGRALNLNLELEPMLAKHPLVSARIAGYYWHSRGLNQLADRGDFLTITKRINGGTNGYVDRVQRWTLAKEVLGC